MRLSHLLDGVLIASTGWVIHQSGASLRMSSGIPADPNNFVCTVAAVTDGDTWRCLERGSDGRQLRVRLAGVNARETDGTCPGSAPCPAASEAEARAVLVPLIAGQVLQCQANGSTYGRRAAFCERSDGVDVSCAMLDSGTVALWPTHWRGHRC